MLPENAALGERLHSKPLVLHSDNGSPMRVSTLLAKLYDLEKMPSNSQPRFLDDDDSIESLFKTLKVTLRCARGVMKCNATCREWTQKFVQYYNCQHGYKGISWVTPAQRHDGQDVGILKKRSKVYAAARQGNPNRWLGEEGKRRYIKSVGLNGQKERNKNKLAAYFATTILNFTGPVAKNPFHCV